MGIHIEFTDRDAKKLVIALILFEVLLTALFLVASEIFPNGLMMRLFDLDRETTIPTWFSSMQLLLIGILFLSSDHWPRRHLIVSPRYLFFAGIGFIYLSMDEAAEIHEKITAVLKVIDWIPRFEGDHGIWILVYLLFAIVLLVIGGRTILSFFKIYSRQAKLISLGGTIFLLGAVGLEILSYQYLSATEYSHLYKYEVALEELFEMAGASVILYGTILCTRITHFNQ